MSVSADEDEHSIEMHLPYVAKVMEEWVWWLGVGLNLSSVLGGAPLFSSFFVYAPSSSFLGVEFVMILLFIFFIYSPSSFWGANLQWSPSVLVSSPSFMVHHLFLGLNLQWSSSFACVSNSYRNHWQCIFMCLFILCSLFLSPAPYLTYFLLTFF